MLQNPVYSANICISVILNKIKGKKCGVSVTLDFTSRWIAGESEARKHVSSVSCFSVLVKLTCNRSFTNGKTAAGTKEDLLAVRALFAKQDLSVISVNKMLPTWVPVRGFLGFSAHPFYFSKPLAPAVIKKPQTSAVLIKLVERFL